jgi:hypothetical protein
VAAESGDAGLARTMTRGGGRTPAAGTPAVAAELQRALLAWETEGGGLAPDPMRSERRVRAAVSPSDRVKHRWTSA